MHPLTLDGYATSWHPSGPPTTTQRSTAGAKPLATSVQKPQLSAVIVNYQQWQNTAALARQILHTRAGRFEQVEIVVVDNHSSHHPLAGQLRRTSGVSLRCWKRNPGFAQAVNEGCRLSRGEWLLLLNPDITLAPDFIAGILQLVDELEPRCGVVGFALRNPDGSRQLSTGRFPTLLSTVLGLGRPRACRKYHRVHARQRCAVPWISGCCLLIRRACFQQVGGFDPSFFLYYEDVDFCRRAQLASWSVMYEPRWNAIHHQPLQARALTPQLKLITRHGLLNYAAQHWPHWQSWLLAGVVGLETWFRSCTASNALARKLYRCCSAMAGDFMRGDRQRARRRCLRGLRRHSPRSSSARTPDVDLQQVAGGGTDETELHALTSTAAYTD